MKTRASKLSPIRVAFFVLLCLGALTPLGCSSTGHSADGRWGDNQAIDYSKIFVYAVTPSPNLQLPIDHANAPQALTQAIQQQLAEENWLQTDESVHSLSFYGVILSYQDGIIDAQGELYDDDQYLVFSRVKRRLEPGENWDQGLNLVAEQMLDELMVKMQPPTGGSAGTPPCRLGDYGCTPIMLVQPAPSLIYFDNYCWGCWRYDDYGHGDHDRPKPKPHWVSGAIIESAPRSSYSHDIKVHTQRGGEGATGGSSHSGGGYGGSSSTTGSSTFDSTTHDSGNRPSRTIYVPPSRGDTGSEERSDRIIEAPRSHEVERHPRSETRTDTPAGFPHVESPRSETHSSPPAVHEAPRSETHSSPPAVHEAPRSETHSSPPVVHEAPRSETYSSPPVVHEAPRSETHSSPPVMHESPRSHESSSGSSGSSGSSSGGSSSGGGHSGGHGGHSRD